MLEYGDILQTNKFLGPNVVIIWAPSFNGVVVKFINILSIVVGRDFEENTYFVWDIGFIIFVVIGGFGCFLKVLWSFPLWCIVFLHLLYVHILNFTTLTFFKII